MGIFVEPDLVIVEIDGYKISLKKEMDAGDQDDLEQEMFGAEMSEGTPKPIIRTGKQKLLELNVKKIVSPEGKDVPVTPALLRTLSRQVRAKLLDKITELNPPFSVNQTA